MYEFIFVQVLYTLWRSALIFHLNVLLHAGLKGVMTQKRCKGFTWNSNHELMVATSEVVYAPCLASKHGCQATAVAADADSFAPRCQATMEGWGSHVSQKINSFKSTLVMKTVNTSPFKCSSKWIFGSYVYIYCCTVIVRLALQQQCFKCFMLVHGLHHLNPTQAYVWRYGERTQLKRPERTLLQLQKDTKAHRLDFVDYNVLK